MNILITGAKGFLGKELTRYFNQKYTVIAADRETLDPTKYEDVKQFFMNNKIDVVIHTANKGGKRNSEQGIMDFYENITMFNNLAHFSGFYNLMFNFGSGAEFDRRSPIDRAEEKNIENCNPIDYYGLSKNLITRKINNLNKNIVNLRLFGCFGELEEPQRLLRANYDKIKNHQNPIIFKDKYMDYFFVEDVATTIEYIINNLNDLKHKDINLCYRDKYPLSDLVYKMKKTLNSNCSIIIQDEENFDKPYTGVATRLEQLNLDLIGLTEGIKRCVKLWELNNS